MKLTSFSVKGFKNFRDEVTLEGLGDINILHGENNVGKSNLMEALLLALELAKGAFKPSPAQDVLLFQNGQTEKLPSWCLDRAERVPFQWFYLQGQEPITLTLRIALEISELVLLERDCPIESDDPRLQTAIFARGKKTGFYEQSMEWPQPLLLELVQVLSRTEIVSRRSCRLLEKDLKPIEHGPLLTLQLPNGSGLSTLGVSLIRADRRGTEPVEAGGQWLSRPSLFPQGLLKELRRCEESVEEPVHQKWELFERQVCAFSQFKIEALRVLMDNDGKHALAATREKRRYVIEDLGTGVQQLAALMGNIALKAAPILLLEEPELNLRYDLQLELREMLQQLVRLEGGPRQLFITSHSPAFETDHDFYLLELRDGVPVIRRTPASERLKVTHTEALSQALPDRPEVNSAYVTREGLVRVPTRILEKLELGSGGGVKFLFNEKSGYVELLTDDQVDALFDAPVPPPSEDESVEDVP